MRKILVILMLTFLLTGCKDYHELQDLGVVSNLFIDYDGEYKIDVEIPEEEESKHYKGRGITLENAIQNTMESTKQYLYFTHMNTVVLTPNVDIEKCLKYLARNPNINNTFFIVMTENDEVLKLEETGVTLKSILKRYDADIFFDINKSMADPNLDYVLPVYKDGYVNSFAVIKNNEVAAYLNEEQIQIYRMLKKESDSHFTGTCGKEDYEVKTNEVSLKTDIKDKIKMTVNLSLSLSVFNCDLDLTKESDVKEFQTMTEKKIKDETTSFLEFLKEKEIDILNLNNSVINEKKDTKGKYYDYDIEVKINSNVNKKGLILK